MQSPISSFGTNCRWCALFHILISQLISLPSPKASCAQGVFGLTFPFLCCLTIILGLLDTGEKYMERHTVSTAFLFMRPTVLTYQLLDGWSSNLAGPFIKGDQPAFAKALRGELSKAMDMAIMPMAAFPSSRQIQLSDAIEASDIKTVRLYSALMTPCAASHTAHCRTNLPCN